MEMARQVAPTDAAVLLRGESGTGKTVLARAIHGWSRRSGKPFGVVSCPSLPAELLTSELFGHVKGAFSGAVENTIGKIELADGGTLFLDEIANITINMQARLLRVVQEREISRVGSTGKKTVNVRIIAATNRDLQQAVREGKFREDLYYRLNVIQIPIPPLRKRADDIPALAAFYLKKLAAEKGKRVAAISEEAMKFMKGYAWPGNVRELINALEFAVVTCETEAIGLPDLPYAAEDAAPAIEGDGGALARLEQVEIIKALEQFQGNKTRAAEYLGINRKTLREKMQKYGL